VENNQGQPRKHQNPDDFQLAWVFGAVYSAPSDAISRFIESLILNRLKVKASISFHSIKYNNFVKHSIY
jgi:hypothetical protein